MTTIRPQSRTLGDLVDELAAATPHAPALVSGAERLDFARLKARIDSTTLLLVMSTSRMPSVSGVTPNTEKATSYLPKRNSCTRMPVGEQPGL